MAKESAFRRRFTSSALVALAVIVTGAVSFGVGRLAAEIVDDEYYEEDYYGDMEEYDGHDEDEWFDEEYDEGYDDHWDEYDEHGEEEWFDEGYDESYDEGYDGEHHEEHDTWDKREEIIRHLHEEIEFLEHKAHEEGIFEEFKHMLEALEAKRRAYESAADGSVGEQDFSVVEEEIHHAWEKFEHLVKEKHHEQNEWDNEESWDKDDEKDWESEDHEWEQQEWEYRKPEVERLLHELHSVQDKAGGELRDEIRHVIEYLESSLRGGDRQHVDYKIGFGWELVEKVHTGGGYHDAPPEPWPGDHDGAWEDKMHRQPGPGQDFRDWFPGQPRPDGTSRNDWNKPPMGDHGRHFSGPDFEGPRGCSNPEECRQVCDGAHEDGDWELAEKCRWFKEEMDGRHGGPQRGPGPQPDGSWPAEGEWDPAGNHGDMMHQMREEMREQMRAEMQMMREEMRRSMQEEMEFMREDFRSQMRERFEQRDHAGPPPDGHGDDHRGERASRIAGRALIEIGSMLEHQDLDSGQREVLQQAIASLGGIVGEGDGADPERVRSILHEVMGTVHGGDFGPPHHGGPGGGHENAGRVLDELEHMVQMVDEFLGTADAAGIDVSALRDMYAQAEAHYDDAAEVCNDVADDHASGERCRDAVEAVFEIFHDMETTVRSQAESDDDLRSLMEEFEERFEDEEGYHEDEYHEAPYYEEDYYGEEPYYEEDYYYDEGPYVEDHDYYDEDPYYDDHGYEDGHEYDEDEWDEEWDGVDVD